MKSVSLKIVGLSPVLMHNPAAMSRAAAMGVKTIPTAQDEAERSAYRTEDGELYLPADGFRSGMLKRACAGRRIGKRGASLVVSGALFLTAERFLLTNGKGKPIKEWTIDTRRAVVMRAGILRSRARVEQWQGVLTYEYDEDFLNPAIILELQQLAGKLAGIGDYRPDCRGPFGRYTVTMA